MKTTYLFKMSGAWSPLWNLSQEKFFELKEKVIWHFSCSISESVMEYQQQIQKQIDAALQNGWMPKISKKQMEIFNQPHHLDCIGYGHKHADSMVFSEYQENYTCNPNPDVVSDVIFRAEELFGTDHVGFENRRIFINTALSGIPFVVLNKGNGKFEFRQ